MGKKNDRNLLFLAVGALLLFGGANLFKVTSDGISVNNDVQVQDSQLADDQLTIRARAQNPLNSSLQYVGATMYYVVDGTQQGSGALNAGGSGTAFANVVTTANFGDQYMLQTLNDPAYAYVSFGPFTADKKTITKSLTVPQSSDLKFTVYDNKAGTELTNSSVSPEQDVSTVTAISIGTSTTANLNVFVVPSTGSSQFGSDDPNAPSYICVDYDKAYYDDANDIKVRRGGVALNTVALPDECATGAYELAFDLGTPIKGEELFGITIKSSKQDAGTSQDVKFLFVDSHAYELPDGTITIGTEDATGTDVGETNRYITISAS